MSPRATQMSLIGFDYNVYHTLDEVGFSWKVVGIFFNACAYCFHSKVLPSGLFQFDSILLITRFRYRRNLRQKLYLFKLWVFYHRRHSYLPQINTSLQASEIRCRYKNPTNLKVTGIVWVPAEFKFFSSIIGRSQFFLFCLSGYSWKRALPCPKLFSANSPMLCDVETEPVVFCRFSTTVFQINETLLEWEVHLHRLWKRLSHGRQKRLTLKDFPFDLCCKIFFFGQKKILFNNDNAKNQNCWKWVTFPQTWK